MTEHRVTGPDSVHRATAVCSFLNHQGVKSGRWQSVDDQLRFHQGGKSVLVASWRCAKPPKHLGRRTLVIHTWRSMAPVSSHRFREEIEKVQAFLRKWRMEQHKAARKGKEETNGQTAVLDKRFPKKFMGVLGGVVGAVGGVPDPRGGLCESPPEVAIHAMVQYERGKWRAMNKQELLEYAMAEVLKVVSKEFFEDQKHDT